jgi:hypothetical protein
VGQQVGEQTVVAYQRQLLSPMMKAAGPILPHAVAVIRRLDHLADRTGKPARSLPDGKQMKRVSTGETGPKLRTASPQSECLPPNHSLNMRGDDPAGVIGHHVLAKRGELNGHDVVATGQNRTDLALDAVQVEIPSRLTEVPRAVDEGDHPHIQCGFDVPLPIRIVKVM